MNGPPRAIVPPEQIWICHVTHATTPASAADAPRGGGGGSPCDAGDAAALRDLYGAMGGLAWTVGWDMSTDCCGWRGVGCDGDGRVARLCVPCTLTRARECDLVAFFTKRASARPCVHDIASLHVHARRMRWWGARDLRSNGLRGTVPTSISTLSALREM